ncbi:MAG TPA: hypothetical protein VFK86_20150 [Bauldia sp.]|jgi:hypothetical protein|nr:hypothetical protein [Bauldia sp.]
MAGQAKGEAAAESSAKAKNKENFELGVKVVDDNVKKIDKGIRRISKELHKVADAVKKQ